MYFWQTYSPNTVFVDDAIFSNCNFEQLYTSQRKKLTLLESWDQTGRKTQVLFENTNSEIWPYGPDVDLTLLCCWLAWGQIAKWLRFFVHSTCKSDHVSCTVYPKKEFWFWWPFVTWPRPWPVLVWHLCSQGILTIPLRSLWLSFEQKLSILPSPGFIIQKPQNFTFDLTLTRELSSILKP